MRVVCKQLGIRGAKQWREGGKRMKDFVVMCMDLQNPVENPLREASYDLSGSRRKICIDDLGGSHPPCSYYGMKFIIIFHPDDAIQTSG
jgi:hypothetical protein